MNRNLESTRHLAQIDDGTDAFILDHNIRAYFSRVHVSEVTLGFLKDEFEVEPAYGEKREEMLRQAGIKTYFIVKVLKPVKHHDITFFKFKILRCKNIYL